MFRKIAKSLERGLRFDFSQAENYFIINYDFLKRNNSKSFYFERNKMKLGVVSNQWDTMCKNKTDDTI